MTIATHLSLLHYFVLFMGVSVNPKGRKRERFTMDVVPAVQGPLLEVLGWGAGEFGAWN